MDTRELAWAAGLFDGEGCSDASQGGTYPRLQLAMTDEDAVRRFHRAVGVGRVHRLDSPSFRGRKQMWRWRVTSFEGAQAVIAMLWYGLSQRRKDIARNHFNYQVRSGN